MNKFAESIVILRWGWLDVNRAGLVVVKDIWYPITYTNPTEAAKPTLTTPKPKMILSVALELGRWLGVRLMSLLLIPAILLDVLRVY